MIKVRVINLGSKSVHTEVLRGYGFSIAQNSIGSRSAVLR